MLTMPLIAVGTRKALELGGSKCAGITSDVRMLAELPDAGSASASQIETVRGGEQGST
jgi:hypothetical protein